MGRRLGCLLTFALLCTSASSCAQGRVYTRVTVPLDLDYERTLIGERTEDSDVKHYSYRSVDVKWDSNAIGEIALRHGFEEVYYADLETVSFLGFFTQNIVHIYGR